MKRIDWSETNIKSTKTYSLYYVNKNGERVYVASGVTFSEANREASSQRHFYGRECTIVEDDK